MNRGTVKTSKSICKEIVTIGLDSSLCGGAIQALALNVKDAFASNVDRYPRYFFYFFLLAWALIPVLTSEWIKSNRTMFLVVLCFVAPLFVVASDYGRWIFMFNIQLVICMLASGLTQNIFSRVRVSRLIVFLFLFSIPHSNIQVEETIFGPIQSVMAYIGSIPEISRVFR